VRTPKKTGTLKYCKKHQEEKVQGRVIRWKVRTVPRGAFDWRKWGGQVDLDGETRHQPSNEKREVVEASFRQVLEGSTKKDWILKVRLGRPLRKKGKENGRSGAI